jgi:hypothetical protein
LLLLLLWWWWCIEKLVKYSKKQVATWLPSLRGKQSIIQHI